MRLSVILTTAAPLVLAIPTPEPQDAVTTPLTGTLGGLLQGVDNIGSLLNALPAVIQDLGALGEAASTVTRKYSTHCNLCIIGINFFEKRQLQIELLQGPMFQLLYKSFLARSNQQPIQPQWQML